MGRIRTIKPEFPQSESVGKLSRDARLLFIQLWTIADDEGRARAASRMIASLLYPYDDDAPGLIEGWLSELEQHRKIRRYEVDGSQYLEIVKWLEHQKIDRPSKSRLPSFDEGSRIIAESSTTDLGPRTLDLGPIADAAAPASERPSAEVEYFRRVKEICGNTAGGLAKKLLDAKDGNIALARAAAEQASTKQDPREYLGGIIRNRGSPEDDWLARRSF